MNRPRFALRPAHISLLAFALLPGLGSTAAADVVPAVKETPESLDDLRVVQQQVHTIVDRVIPSVVGVRIGAAMGSGVIVSPDGYVLTAGHVCGRAGREVTVYLADGKQVKGQTLGANFTADSGMIKLAGDHKWPFVAMGRSADLYVGQWCIGMGHPGGARKGRPPVVRLGRVLTLGKRFVRTDCTIINGDSGGPLFDLDGKVIGIHSHISEALTGNMHVVVDTYRDTWDRLAKGETWGGGSPYIGVRLDAEAPQCAISEVDSGSPAERAGLQPGDVVLKFDGRPITGADDLVTQTARQKPGDRVLLEVRRDSEVLTLEVVIGRRGS